MAIHFERVMPPKTGLAVEIETGRRLRVIDIEGQQVVDMAVFNRHNQREKLSTSYSRTRYIPGPGPALRAARQAARQRHADVDDLPADDADRRGDPRAQGNP